MGGVPTADRLARAGGESSGSRRSVLRSPTLRTALWLCLPALIVGSWVRADLLLRCGKPRDGLKEVTRLFKDAHSAAEQGLAGVFGQLNRFKRYKLELARRVKADPEDVQARRSLAELLLCGDWSTRLGKRFDGEAAEQFEALRGTSLGACEMSGRAAVARLLEAAKPGEADPKDLARIGVSHATFQKNAQPLDHSGRHLGKIGQGALLDLAVLAIALAQQHGGRRGPVGYGLDEHRRRESDPIRHVKIYLHGHNNVTKTPPC